jgi:hypothetical protein
VIIKAVKLWRGNQLEKRDLLSSLQRASEKLFVKITVESKCLRITANFHTSGVDTSGSSTRG